MPLPSTIDASYCLDIAVYVYAWLLTVIGVEEYVYIQKKNIQDVNVIMEN